MYEIKDFVITGVILLIIISTWATMRASKNADNDLNKQEDEDNDSISGDVIDLRFYHGGVEDEDILRNAN